MRDLVDGAKSPVGSALWIQVLHGQGIEVETGLEIRHGHLGRVPPYSLLGHGKARCKPNDTVNIKGHLGYRVAAMIGRETDMDRISMGWLCGDTTVHLLPPLTTDLTGKVVLPPRHCRDPQNIGKSALGQYPFQVVFQARMICMLSGMLSLPLAMAVHTAAMVGVQLIG